MTTTHLGSKLWVVLNSNRLVAELYGRKGSMTNGRPHYPMVGELISQNRRSVLLPQNGWTDRRRVMHQLLNGTALTRYQEYQDEESRQLMVNYLNDPQHWYLHNGTYSNTVIHRITFGQKPSASPEEMAEVTKAQFAFLMNAPPYNFWDCFPELARLPNAVQFWRSKFAAMGRHTMEAYSAYWAPLRQSMEKEDAAQSFARDLVLDEAKFQGSSTDKMFLAMQLIEAGSDTTRLGINIFILAAISHPDKFQKARDQIDSLCGGGDQKRLPKFWDEPDLPYINAFAKEMLRWRRIFDWTPEHTLTEDLVFEDYHFPKGTNFIINHVSIANDKTLYPNPQEFQPERWLDGREAEIWNGSWQFGHGRRICVGYRLAQKSLFITLARLIYCFDFQPAAGTKLKQRGPFDNSSINHFATGEPFPVNVRVRGEEYANLIMDSHRKQ
ncbi:uncharacterized protein A1O9_08002 [Exophiala aquamarina CBS 119918]|uniref:Cytochrome P450 oxidoreductase n=1 Tax=Exophiala aquamarina CBS 119918 TaxID=1182545 RepID=A0A072P974_9EURO|nr:uncharacterized protein A1O9_08002 [Exophiala aquamarina CBS 119918]KEF56421.1 hypothetical protein A1O9_08002 [Exophiala aquamarina CBS 119918]